MKIRLDTFNILMFISSGISLIVTLFYYDNFTAGYKGVITLPILFLIMYFFILQNLRSRNFPFTVYGIIVMQWIRFVLMPPVLAIAGDNVGFHYINPTTESLELAVLLMIYEMIIISILSLVWFYSKPQNIISKLKNERLLLKGNRLVYFMFTLVVLGIIITIGRSNNLFNFLYIPIEGTGRVGDVTDTYLILARQFVIIGLFLAFLWTVNYCRLKYEKKHKKIYVDISIVMAILNVAIIVGERRTAQIYTATICMWVLLKSFPVHKKRILISIGTMAITVLTFMSIYKFFAAFQHGSYVAAMNNSNADAAWLSRTLQSYFFGPENIAAMLDFSNLHNLRIGNIIYDISRSTFGISFLLKGRGVLTSELFNTYVYGTVTSSGHVISAIGYGYTYFGILLAPIVTMFNIVISSVMEAKMYNSKTYEMAYIWGYVLIRFSTNLFVNTAPLISYATITLGTGGLLFYAAIILKINKKSSKRYYINSNQIRE